MSTYLENYSKKNNRIPIKITARKIFDATILDVKIGTTSISLRVSEANELIEKIQEKL